MANKGSSYESDLNRIRANFDDDSVRVYQAYSDEIADSALRAGTFTSPPFSFTRMTWIKPSFLWMMYRSGWGLKEANQSRILAIDITHEGFQWALANSRLAQIVSPRSPLASAQEAPVLVQWDPDRDLFLQPTGARAIQIGLRNMAMKLYVERWIVRIADVTTMAHTLHDLVERGDIEKATSLLPEEFPYSFP